MSYATAFPLSVAELRVGGRGDVDEEPRHGCGEGGRHGTRQKIVTHPCEEGCDLAEQGAERARQGAGRRAWSQVPTFAGMAHLPNPEATSRSGCDPGLRWGPAIELDGPPESHSACVLTSFYIPLLRK